MTEIDRARTEVEQAMYDAKELANTLPDGFQKLSALTLVLQLVSVSVILGIRLPEIPCNLDLVASNVREPANASMRHAVNAVVVERLRQVNVEGWTPSHDDRHSSGGLSEAAGCYAMFSETFPEEGKPPPQWPWLHEWWKPKDYRCDLVRAAAMLIAEIERIDRRAQRSNQTT